MEVSLASCFSVGSLLAFGLISGLLSGVVRLGCWITSFDYVLGGRVMYGLRVWSNAVC